MTSIETITANLSRLLDGEPAPSFDSLEAAELIRALGSISFPMDHARIGSEVSQMILARLKSTFAAERELALLKDGSHLI